MPQVQLTLFNGNNFSNVVHTKENNEQSQKILNANKTIFSAQCNIVYKALMSGIRLTTYKALMGIRIDDKIYKIGDLRRRIKDLKDFKGGGISISEILNKERYKVWYISEQDYVKNKEFEKKYFTK